MMMMKKMHAVPEIIQIRHQLRWAIILVQMNQVKIRRMTWEWINRSIQTKQKPPKMKKTNNNNKNNWKSYLTFDYILLALPLCFLFSLEIHQMFKWQHQYLNKCSIVWKRKKQKYNNIYMWNKILVKWVKVVINESVYN